MLIRKLDPDQFVDSYCCKEQMFYPWSDVVTTPFGTGWLVLEPGAESKPHNHHESETFFILRGRGRMTVGVESREVEPGDVIYLPPFGDHILRNVSDEDLHFISIWWESPTSVASLKDRASVERRPSVLALVAASAEDAADASNNAEIHARYARLTGARVRTLVDLDNAADIADIADAADNAEASSLFARLATAGAVETREGTALFALGPHADAIREHARRAALSPRLQAVVEETLEEGLADFAVATRNARGELLFDPRFARAARLLAAAREGEAIVVFLTPDQVFTYAVLLPALAGADTGASAYAPATLVLEAAPDDPLAALAGGRSWLAGLGRRLARDHSGRAPSTQAWTAEQHRFVGRLLRAVEEAGLAYQAATFAPREALDVVARLVRAAGEFAEREAPWGRFVRRQEERNTGVAVELLAAKVLACLAYPLAPEWSARLWQSLGYTSSLGESTDGEALWEETPAWVPSGQPIDGLEELAQSLPQPGAAASAPDTPSTPPATLSAAAR